MQNNSQILLAENLQKHYGPRHALQGLSFSLQAGHILGFLGPNGAGKTTSIRILTTMMEPDSGQFSVAGISSKCPNEIRRRIGVLPESLGFPRQITAIEFLTYYGRLYGRAKADAQANGWLLLDNVGLKTRGKSLVGTYSHGMRQRLGIARALVNDPSVIFLDEPTLGLDPRGQQELLSLIQQISRERNVGVVLCSHMLSEIEEVCDDVIILLAGKVIASGSVADVVGQTRQNAFRIRTLPTSVAEAHEILKAMSRVKVTLVDETAGWLRIELVEQTGNKLTEDYHASNRILKTLIQAKIPVLSFEAEGGRLQDIFLQLTEETIK
jgi:ABC-2 type transport system ATP-binding protein